MSETKIPAIPEPPQGALYGFLSAVKNAVEVRLGLRGDKLDRAVTLRELFSSGVITGISGGISAPVSSGSAWGYTLAVPPVDLTPPPAPTSLTTGATWSQIFLEWDWGTYSNHDVTEIWRRQVGTDPAVNYGTCSFDGEAYSDGCQMVASPSGKVWQDNVGDIVNATGDGQEYYYWVRLKSTAGITGDPYPSAAAGILGTLTKDPAHALALLTESITSSELSTNLISNITTTMYTTSTSGVKPTTKPDGSSLVVGDLVVDAANNFIIYRYAGLDGSTPPVPIWVSIRDSGIAQALGLAGDAQSTADGSIQGFFQDAIPSTAQSSFGDIWIDTDNSAVLDSSAIFRYENQDGGALVDATGDTSCNSGTSACVLSWQGASSSAIGGVYLKAYQAQATADGKIVTFYQSVVPTGSLGDLWVNTDGVAGCVVSGEYDPNITTEAACTASDGEWVAESSVSSNGEVYRCATASCSTITSGEWERIGIPTASEVEVSIANHDGVCWNKNSSPNVKDWVAVTTYTDNTACTTAGYEWESSGVLAGHTVDVHSAAAGNTTNIQQTMSTVNGVRGEYTVRIDSNDAVAGFGLAAGVAGCVVSGEYDPNITTEADCTASVGEWVAESSSFIVNADKFAIQSNDGVNTSVPFIVDNSDPEDPYIGIDGALVVDGTISANEIASSAITADKIKAGEVTATKLSTTDIYSVTMESTNYVSGTSGWNIGKDGSAEFNSGTFRGTLSVESPPILNSSARMEMTNSTLKVYDSAGTLRVKIGDLS